MFWVESVSHAINVETDIKSYMGIHMWMHTIFQPTIYNINITLLSKLGEGFVSKRKRLQLKQTMDLYVVVTNSTVDSLHVVKM